MDLKEQLEASIQNMEGGKYEGAAKLFEEVVKVFESSQPLSDAITNDIVATAYNWVDELKYYWRAAKKDKALRSLLLKEFKSLELKLKEHGKFTSWLDETKDLSRKVTTAQNRLEEQGEKKVNFIYKPEYRAEDSTLEDYVNIGTYLTSKTSVIIKEMTELTKTTYEKIIGSPSITAPSFIVCSSSGTGKTQLPFSLEIPLLYFCCAFTDNPQPIYGLYQKISKHFLELLDKDFLAFTEALKKNPEIIRKIQRESDAQNAMNSSSINEASGSQTFVNAEVRENNLIKGNVAKYPLDYFSILCLKTVPCKFRAPSFLIQLIAKIKALEEENEKKNKGSGEGSYSQTIWPKLQLSLKEEDEIIPNEQKIEESKRILKEMYLGKPATGSMEESEESNREPKFDLPLIFLDEFNVNSDTDPEPKARYAFYRNIIRACGLIPVLMGTNSQITNVITAGAQSGNKANIWAHIFYELPKYPQNLFDENVDNVEGLSDLNRVTFKSLYTLLEKERPLFVQSIFNDINDDFEKPDPASDSVIPWLEYILSKFRMSFSERKSGFLKDFCTPQAELFINSYNRIFNEGEECIPLSLIHTYLAYLTPPEDIHPKNYESYFDIYQLGKTVQYKFKDKYGKIGYRKFEPISKLPEFGTESLTCMAFSQNESEDFCSFRSSCSFEEPSEQFTTFQAVTKFQKPSKQKPKNWKAKKSFHGSILEQIVSMAFMISSHTKFLTGMPFKNWFEYFIQQLACYDSNKFEIPKKITFDSSFKLGDDFRVPYFAFDCASWPEGFENLKGFDHFHLGTYSGAFHESCDLYATTALYQKDFDSKNEKRKLSENDLDSVEDEQDLDDQEDEMETSSFADSDSESINESIEISEYLEPNNDSSGQSNQIKSGPSNTPMPPSVSINTSDQISPESTRIFRKGFDEGGIFSVECKLRMESLSRSVIKKIIINMKEAKLHSKFNFIIAKQISPQIKLDHDEDYFKKIARIEQLGRLIKGLDSTKKMKQTGLNPTSTNDPTENDSKQKHEDEKARLRKELKNKIPYKDISIFRLKCVISDPSIEMLSESECYYTSSRFGLNLAPVYNWKKETNVVFILIDLTEIHGKIHLMDCIRNFKE